MSLNKLFRTDRQKEVDGITINYTDEEGNVLAWFKCKRPGGRNVEFQKALNRRTRQHREELQDQDENEADPKFRRILAEAYADAIILDWGGDIEGPDGKTPAPCTHENIVWVLSEDCPDLFDDLRMRLSNRLAWQARQKEAASKNSKPASSTN
jgi:hypothetical protein